MKGKDERGEKKGKEGRKQEKERGKKFHRRALTRDLLLYSQCLELPPEVELHAGGIAVGIVCVEWKVAG